MLVLGVVRRAGLDQERIEEPCPEFMFVQICQRIKEETGERYSEVVLTRLGA